MIRIILILLLSASSVLADENNYWAIVIPVVERATNVTRDRNEKFYVISLSYEVVISDTKRYTTSIKNFSKRLVGKIQ